MEIRKWLHKWLRVSTRQTPFAGFCIYWWNGLCIHFWRTILMIEWS